MLDDSIPMDVEIEEINLNKRLYKSLDKLTLYEDSIGKDLKSLAKSMKNATDELSDYLETQNQVVRLYIQLINRESDLVSNHDLQLLKAHVKKVENRVQNQQNLIGTFKDLSSGYKEYSKSLKDYTKSVSNLLKTQENWHNASSELAKVKHNPRVTGQKLEKIEKKIVHIKKKVLKRYEERRHKNGFIKHALQRISDAWLKLKNQIIKFEW